LILNWYELIDERPAPFRGVPIKPTAEVGGLPIGRFAYMRRFARVFTAKTNDGQLMEIQALITQKWDGSIDIDVEDQEEISSIS